MCQVKIEIVRSDQPPENQAIFEDHLGWYLPKIYDRGKLPDVCMISGRCYLPDATHGNSHKAPTTPSPP